MIDASGRVGVNVFFAEAGISGSIATKKEGEFRLTSEYVWQKGDQTTTDELYRDIMCEHSEPANLLKLTLQDENGDKSIQIYLDDFKQKSCHEDAGQGCSDWIFLKGSGDAYDRMVIVNDWPSYNALFRQIKGSWCAGESGICRLQR